MSFKLILLLPFLASMMYGAGYVFLERVLDVHINPATFLVVNTLTNVLAVLFLVFVHGYAVEINSVFKSLPVFALVLAAAAAPSIGWVATIYSIKYISAIYTALVETSYPLFTLAFGLLFFGLKEWNWITLSGGVLIMAGAAVMLFGQNKIEAQEP
jgi:drug/metabolite transporter (DMT)-like permease